MIKIFADVRKNIYLCNVSIILKRIFNLTLVRSVCENRPFLLKNCLFVIDCLG